MNENKKKSGKVSTTFMIAALIVGLSLLLYPTLSDYWNSFTQSKAIAEYAEAVDNIDPETYGKILADAKDYNQKLIKRENRYVLNKRETDYYNSQLNLTGNGIMGYIDIPSIACSLPIYHTVNDSVLQVAVGHVEWSSLPVGGENTHCVLSGHRGLPSAKLFSDLDKLTEGDVFIISVLNETFTYQIDRISIVLPKEIDSLSIEEGESYCTLVTCTPYGVNSHRILVRGHLIDNIDEVAKTTIISDAMQIEPYIVAPIIAIPILLVMFIFTGVQDRKKKKFLKEHNLYDD